MKKENRLRKNHDFQRIIGSRKSKVSKHAVLYFQPNKFKRMRIGISVSKKFINAVGRNSVRRQVRAILDEAEQFHKPLDVVLIVRKPFINASYASKKETIVKLLKGI